MIINWLDAWMLDGWIQLDGGGGWEDFAFFFCLCQMSKF